MLSAAHSEAFVGLHAPGTISSAVASRRRPSLLGMMVRNIDLPEAVILYGRDNIKDPAAVADHTAAREGLIG
jgi:hypothetical protein